MNKTDKCNEINDKGVQRDIYFTATNSIKLSDCIELVD